MPITSRLVVNPGALKLKRDAIQPLIDALAAAVSQAGAASPAAA
jgi:ATP phosphoribosyltransferase